MTFLNKGFNWAAAAICGLMIHTSALAVNPDAIGIFGPKNGIYTVQILVGQDSYEIQIEGDLTSKKNKKILKTWIDNTVKKKKK